ncbi:hypothetical protein CH373_03215 [Leptospira perolatii]|uniref:NADH:quinone oxidoreductase/Mrp antiporter transmembrane domain-containing protein n=1 Tax=Leptospira perolatii TaxID=2023191 RepID=A0A2M9ZSP9_9LEPT|nr:proton-conducting transporter membrane subunit [Leptospira perolatii]PJZ75045.1 hypothetical protein CH373_03215 [Leptospira perolatii]
MILFQTIASLFLAIPLLFLDPGKLMPGQSQFPLLVGLGLQFVCGSILIHYVYGYEYRNRGWILFGYLIFFGGLAGSYLSGKSHWLWIFWETATYGTLGIHSGHNLGHKSVKSTVALFIASGLSMLCLAVWVYLPTGTTGTLFLIVGLLVKAAFFGFHFWLPEANGGAPAHLAAAFSGLMDNLPLLLFATNVTPVWADLGLGKFLIPLAGIGVFFSGIVSFFHRDAKKALAYSTVENLNFLWLCLFLASEWTTSSDPTLASIGNGFKILFYIGMVHHSVSKLYQFLAFGYLCRLGGSTRLDKLRGVGRLSGLPSLLLGMGTFSFALVPGSLGFLTEVTFFYLLAQVTDLGGAQAAAYLPGFVVLLIGMVVGGLAHVRIYLPTVLSMPSPALRAWVEKHGSHTVPTTVKTALLSLLILLLILPVLLTAYLTWGVQTTHTGWFKILFVMSLLFQSLFLYIFLKRSHRIQKRSTWDCGSEHKGEEVSIPSHIFSEPLYSSLGRFFVNREGLARVDSLFHKYSDKVMDVGKYWRSWTSSGEVSNYLAFSSIILLLSIVLMAMQKFWR